MERSHFVDNKTLAVIGAGYRGGQPKTGVEEGPSAVRSEGLISALEELGWKVRDKGNLKFDEFYDEEPVDGMKHATYVAKANEKISQTVHEESAAKHAVLTVGGDHSLAIGTISGSGSAWKDLGVIWIDAHADINTPQTSPTGNIHGMPLAFVSGLFDTTKYKAYEWVKKVVSTNKIVYIGLRDVDTGEKAILKQHNLKAFSMTEVDRYGIGKVMEMALDHIDPQRRTPIHLSFDVDSLDPTVAPSTGTRVMGGLSFREGKYICQSVAETGCLVSMDITEVNPSIGSKEDGKKTAAVAVELARSAFGHTLL